MCFSSASAPPPPPGMPPPLVLCAVWDLPAVDPISVLSIEHGDPMATGLVLGTQLGPLSPLAACGTSTALPMSPVSAVNTDTSNRGTTPREPPNVPATPAAGMESPQLSAKPQRGRKSSRRRKSSRKAAEEGCDNCGTVVSTSWRTGRVWGRSIRLCVRCEDCGLLPPRGKPQETAPTGVRVLACPAATVPPAGANGSADAGSHDGDDAAMDGGATEGQAACAGRGRITVECGMLASSAAVTAVDHGGDRSYIYAVATASLAALGGPAQQDGLAKLYTTSVISGGRCPSDDSDHADAGVASCTTRSLECMKAVPGFGRVPCIAGWRSVAINDRNIVAASCCGVVAMWSVRSGRQVGLLLDQANTAPALPSGLCSGYTNGYLRGAASCNAVSFHPSLPMVVTVGGGPPGGTAESCCAMGIDAGACCDADDARDHQHVHLYVPGGPTATSHGGGDGDGDGDHAME